MTEGAGAYFCI